MNGYAAATLALAWYQALAMFRAVAAEERGWALVAALLSTALLGVGLAYA